MAQSTITPQDNQIIQKMIKNELIALELKLSKEKLTEINQQQIAFDSTVDQLRQEINSLNQTNSFLLEQISLLEENMVKQNEELNTTISALMIEKTDETLFQQLSLSVDSMLSNISTIFTSLHNISLEQLNQKDQVMEVKANINSTMLIVNDFQSEVAVKSARIDENTNNLTIISSRLSDVAPLSDVTEYSGMLSNLTERLQKSENNYNSLAGNNTDIWNNLRKLNVSIEEKKTALDKIIKNITKISNRHSSSIDETRANIIHLQDQFNKTVLDFENGRTETTTQIVNATSMDVEIFYEDIQTLKSNFNSMNDISIQLQSRIQLLETKVDRELGVSNFDEEKTKLTNHLAKEISELDTLENLDEDAKMKITNLKNDYEYALNNSTSMKSITWNFMAHTFDNEKKLIFNKTSDSLQVYKLKGNVQRLESNLKLGMITTIVVLIVLLGMSIMTVLCILAKRGEKDVDISPKRFTNFVNY
jgi:predicted  nucleic acid-binding Zn-ribbon protein